MNTFTVEVGRSAKADATLKVRASDKRAAKLIAESHYRSTHQLDHTAQVFTFVTDVDGIAAAFRAVA